MRIVFIDVKNTQPKAVITSFFKRISKTVMQCNLCDKNISKPIANLYRHVKHAHKIGVPYKKATDDDNAPYPFKSRSWVWYYFKRITRDSSQCKLCSRIISQSCNNNGNLNRHLRTKHKITKNQGKHTSARCEVFTEDAMVTTDEDKSVTKSVDEADIATRATNEDPDDTDSKDAKVLDRTDIASSELAEYFEVTDLASDDGTERELVFIDVQEIKRPNIPIWSYFKKISKYVVQCELCSKDIAFSGDSDEMYKHVKTEHKFDEKDGNSCRDDIEDVACLNEKEIPQSLEFRSRVWIHYNPVSKKCSRCKLCAKRISHGSNVQENLTRHLKWKHYVKTSQTESDNIDPSDRPRWSWVWKYFKQVSFNCAQCIICSTKICHGDSATGNLNRHFMRYHKQEFRFERNVKSLHESIVKTLKSSAKTNKTSKETQHSYTTDAYDETATASMNITELSDEKATESIIEASTDTDIAVKTVQVNNETELPTTVHNCPSESILATEQIMELLEDRTDITKRCRSWVWLYYIAVSLSLAQCKICDSLISHGGRGTGNMSRHLKRKHKIENPSERNIACLSNITSTESTEPQQSSDDNNDWIWPLFENESDDVYKCIICQFKCFKLTDEGKTIEIILEHLKTIHGLLSSEQVVIEDEATASFEN